VAKLLVALHHAGFLFPVVGFGSTTKDERDRSLQLNRRPADRRSGQRVRAAAHGARAPVGDRGPERDHAGRALSPAETALAQSKAGAAQVQDFHRQLFHSSADELRREIKRITGVEVLAAAGEIKPAAGTVVQVFTSGTVVQVFLLARSVPAESWSGGEPGGHS
jgi:uncharacterized protein YbcI